MIYTVTLNPAIDKELVVASLAFDTVLRSKVVRLDFGGKGFNVSRMLIALGCKSVALAFAGGHNGKLLQQGLESLGIETDFVWVEDETRTNVSIVTAVSDHYLKVNEPGSFISGPVYSSFLNKVQALAQPDDWWVLAGSLPPGVPDMAYAELIQMIQVRGAHVLLDSSGTALRLGCAALPFLVKPNDEEAQQLTGLPVEDTKQTAIAAKRIQMAGSENVVISLGKSGALLAGEHGVWRAVAPQVKEQNPIGAGDSLLGGLVWGLSQGLPVPEALRWGIACGSATASLSGTAVGSRSLVEALLPQVEIVEYETFDKPSLP